MNTDSTLMRKTTQSLTALLIAVVCCLVLLPETKFAFSFNAAALSPKNNKGDEAFDKKFRDGRDLIDKEEWAKAAEKFNEVISKYPDNKSADAALYWLAFCYKKQKQFKEANATLDRLLKDFPESSWADDARVMKLEIAAPLGKILTGRSAVQSPSLIPEIYTTAINRNNSKAAVSSIVAPQTFEKLNANAQLSGAASSTPLEREDEIKLAAFQSLFSADQKKGIEVMSGVLKADSTASENLKLEVLRAVRRPRIDSNYSVSQLGTPTTANYAASHFVPLLREALVKSFQNETNIKILKEIIYTLAGLKDEQSVNYLSRFYASADNPDVKKAIISGFGSRWGLNGFYHPGISLTQNPNLISSTSVQTQAVEFTRLLEILKIEKNAELRRFALENLEHFVGWEKNAQLADGLAAAYDSEINEEFKKSIVQNLGKMKQSQASKKLLDIAKNDKSDKLKLEAIYALRNSNNPEALKYLEELIK